MRRLMIVTLAVALLTGIGAVAAGQGAGAQAEEKTLVSGWFQDRQVKYYDFGTNTPLAANDTVPTQPIWVFIYGMNADGTPDMVEGQHNIIDVVPGEAGYTDLWRVHFVAVPRDYEADSVRSAEEIDEAGFDVTPTDMLVNCPIVPEGTTLEGGEPLQQGWNDGEAVFYPDFGANPATTQPIWVFIHGMNPDGTPDFVEGQNNIIDTVPGQTDYTAFWRVNLVTVPEDYEPNSIRSAADVVDAGYEITATDMVVNCPVTQVAGAAVSGVPSAGTGVGGGGSPSLPYIIGLLAALGALGAGGAAFAFARRRT